MIYDIVRRFQSGNVGKGVFALWNDIKIFENVKNGS